MGRGLKKQKSVLRDTDITTEEFERFENAIDKVKACRTHRNRPATFRRGFRIDGSKAIKFYGLCAECVIEMTRPEPSSAFNKNRPKRSKVEKK
jgi:hypothetical protein